MKRKASESLPVQRLRHHVTGAIERGETQAIVGIPAIAPQTAQSATIRAAEGKDTAPEALKVGDWTLSAFETFLVETLIPDLRESGRDCTADDFETALQFLHKMGAKLTK